MKETQYLKMPIKFPWHAPVWNRVTTSLDRLPHALILQGAAGLGKNSFALRLGYQLLCSNTTKDGACGKCKSCRLLLAGNHPDLTMIEPEEPGKAIGVDRVRALADFLYLRPHIANHKVTIITPAEAMNINAANSLLKLLEEPPLGSIILLVSNNVSALPATVRSRCTRLAFSPPSTEQALSWLDDKAATKLLAFAGGAPLRAQALKQGNFLGQREKLFQDLEAMAATTQGLSGCAVRWKKAGTISSLEWLQTLVSDLVKLLLTASAPENLRNSDWAPRLQALANRLNLRGLYGFLDTVTEARRALSGPLEEQLLLEDILIRWHRLTR
jgi:DNA polymerase III subunit delta'